MRRAALLAALWMTTACATTVSRGVAVPVLLTPEDEGRRESEVREAAPKNDPTPEQYWLTQVVQPLEEASSPRPDLALACLGSPSGKHWTQVGEVHPNNRILFDDAALEVMAQGHNTIVRHYPKLNALIRVANGDYAHRDEFRMLVLRAVVAMERLLDAHRYNVGQLREAGCLSERALTGWAWEGPAESSWRDALKSTRQIEETLTDLSTYVRSQYDRHAPPMRSRRQYQTRLSVLDFYHQIYSEDSSAAERLCETESSSTRPTAYRLYACGYLYERRGRDADASRFYTKIRGLSSETIEFVGLAKKRQQYVDEWSLPLQTDEARQREGQSPHQFHQNYN